MQDETLSREKPRSVKKELSGVFTQCSIALLDGIAPYPALIQDFHRYFVARPPLEDQVNLARLNRLERRVGAKGQPANLKFPS
eukprot:1137893-Pelagomonas_calceolata.AAC.5